MATYEKYKKKNGNIAWKVDGYLGVDPATGKQVLFKKRGFTNKKSAQLAYNRAKYEVQEHGFKKKNSNSTFRSIYELWLETYQLTVKESSLVKLTQKFDNYILPTFGDKEISKITVAEVQKFANYMCLDKKNSAYKEYVSNVSRIFEYALKVTNLTVNPVLSITMPRPVANLSKDKQIHFYTKDELKKLLEYAESNETTLVYTFFYLLANTGCRQGELLGLQWDCIDFEGKSLRVRQTLTRGKERRLYLDEPKTKKSYRNIPLNDATITILKTWRKVQRSEMLRVGFNTMDSKQFVFTDTENEFIQLTHPRLWLHRIAKKAGIPILSPHALRHTFATILISKGVNFKTVSELLGHSSIGMTMDIYAGVFEEDKTETIDLLANVLS